FPCGFSDGLAGVDTRAMLADGGWREYQERVGAWSWIRWPYDWLSRKGIDGFVPGSAFIAGLLLFLISGRDWARRNWPLLLLAVCQIVFWLLISPMARFAWPWLGVLTLLACSPLDESPVQKCRILMPIVAMLVGLVSMINRLDDPIRSFPVVSGLSSEQAYLASMEERHAGPDMGPPLDGIRELNRRFASGSLPGKVLIDTNMVAYADFPTIPAYDYLVVASLQRRCWWKVNGPPFLSMGGKSVGDDELINELRRVGIGSILARRGTPRAPAGEDGKIHAESEAVYDSADQFNEFIERWVREGRASREEFADSTLYTLRESSKK
ncbi:MAG TPA: hypothetical protein VMV81_11490, partial [Phycisphaerae bacterium]|nr:hypothetical protein [Phycisphaerae bacterium]